MTDGRAAPASRPRASSSRLRAAKLEALRADIERGATSGAGIDATAVFAEIRKRIAARVERR